MFLCICCKNQLEGSLGREVMWDLSLSIRIILMLMFSCLVVVAAAWHATGRPISISEYRFLERLSEQPLNSQGHLDLKSLMPGDWESVCGAHGYGGNFYLEKYGREYPSVGEPQDGAWGVVFIDADGSFTSASGNCQSTGAVISLEGCAARTQAVLQRSTAISGCPSFKN